MIPTHRLLVNSMRIRGLCSAEGRNILAGLNDWADLSEYCGYGDSHLNGNKKYISKLVFPSLQPLNTLTENSPVNKLNFDYRFCDLEFSLSGH